MDCLAARCDSRFHERSSPLLRLLKGHLSTLARRPTIILRSRLAFWWGKTTKRAIRLVGLTLTQGKGWTRFMSHPEPRINGMSSAQLDKAEDTKISPRRASGTRWFYATGTRLAAIVGARCEHLERWSTAQQPEAGTQRAAGSRRQGVAQAQGCAARAPAGGTCDRTGTAGRDPDVCIACTRRARGARPDATEYVQNNLGHSSIATTSG